MKDTEDEALLFTLDCAIGRNLLISSIYGYTDTCSFVELSNSALTILTVKVPRLSSIFSQEPKKIIDIRTKIKVRIVFFITVIALNLFNANIITYLIFLK